MSTLPPPRNVFVEIMKIVFDKLIEGLGVQVAVDVAIANQPWLATPIIKQTFTYLVSVVAQTIDDNTYKIASDLVIRIQNDVRRIDFNQSIQPIINGTPTPEDIQRAKDAADRLINRNRR